MKNKISNGLALILPLFLIVSCSNSLPAQTSASGSITYQTFYDELAPYGTWIDYPGYGHVWNPRIEGEFRPYATNGNWIYSNEGWAWSSNYAWGWAPFHYGRWLYDDFYGWLWVPGYDWSPAWVTWGFVDDYYCWAPLLPGVNVGLAFTTWRPHSFYWNIVGRAHIYDKNISTVIIERDRINTITNRISIINNFNTTRIHNFYSRGPEVGEVEKYTNRKIDRISFADADGWRHENHAVNPVKVYRPEIIHPRPHEFRSADLTRIKPIQRSEEWPSSRREVQRNNLQNLPMHHDGFGSGNYARNSGGRSKR